MATVFECYSNEVVTESIMPRGGARPGSGSKPKWIHGKTKTIRVPESLADKVLELAKMLDEGKLVDDVTQSKYVNLSDVSLYRIHGRPALFLADLVRAGLQVNPPELEEKAIEDIYKQQLLEGEKLYVSEN